MCCFGVGSILRSKQLGSSWQFKSINVVSYMICMYRGAGPSSRRLVSRALLLVIHHRYCRQSPPVLLLVIRHRGHPRALQALTLVTFHRGRHLSPRALPFILAHLQRKKDLCVSEHQVRQYLWFHRMQTELKLMLGRNLEHDPVLFQIPEIVYPT